MAVFGKLALPPPEAEVVETSKLAAAPARPVLPQVKAAQVAQVEKTDQAAVDRGAILLLGLLQREGRLLDFLEENLDTYTDAKVGAAARDIHRNCKKVLAQHVTIEPVMREPDNSTVRVDSGFDPSRIRLVGNVVGQPPFLGTLRHPGWRGVDVKLPDLPTSHDPSVIAPAEVEL